MAVAKSDQWKDKIRSGVLVERLMRHAQGEIEMTSTQIKAADILIRKVIPDLNRTELTGANGGPVEHKDVTQLDKDILADYLSNQK